MNDDSYMTSIYIAQVTTLIHDRTKQGFKEDIWLAMQL